MMTRSVIRLGTYPTPIDPFRTGGNLWIKRDDLSGSAYGGNKVRKLEHLLSEARAEGKTRLLTIGAAGSHQVVATALYGKREGFESVEAVLVGQPRTDHAVTNLRAALSLGLEPIVASSWATAPALVAAHMAKGGRYLVPLGGSSALGSIGFVDAAKELHEQIREGKMPEPDEVVVAMGSGGTAAGLAVGFEKEKMKTKVIGVAISPPVAVLAVMARRLAKKTAERAGLSRRESVHAVNRLEVDKRWLGRGYGFSTLDGDRAVRQAETEAGLHLDATYTAKAFACALSRAQASPTKTILYWHTLSSASLDALVDPTVHLPPNVDALLK